jgi:hypothetical protein
MVVHSSEEAVGDLNVVSPKAAKRLHQWERNYTAIEMRSSNQPHLRCSRLR